VNTLLTCSYPSQCQPDFVHLRQHGFSSPHFNLLILLIVNGRNLTLMVTSLGATYLQVTHPVLLLGVEARFLGGIGVFSFVLDILATVNV
jgi:hypothetical protein